MRDGFRDRLTEEVVAGAPALDEAGFFVEMAPGDVTRTAASQASPGQERPGSWPSRSWSRQKTFQRRTSWKWRVIVS